jgi:hypothetical protein
MSKSDLLTFKSAAPPHDKPDDVCEHAGAICFKGSSGRECMLASRIFCPDWNNPAIYQTCTFVKREAQYKQDGIVK